MGKKDWIKNIDPYQEEDWNEDGWWKKNKKNNIRLL